MIKIIEYIQLRKTVRLYLLFLFLFQERSRILYPATLEEYRSYQPLSALIYRAMVDSVTEKNMEYWNWGGTWLNQSGVYKFKARWGTQDFPYRYHIKTYIDSDKINLISKDTLCRVSKFL